MGLLFAPMNHYWFRYLERIVPGIPTRPIIVAKKVALDCAITPVFSGTFVNGEAKFFNIKGF